MSIAALVAATFIAATPSASNRADAVTATNERGSTLAIFAAKSGGRVHAADPLRVPLVGNLLAVVSLGALAFAGPAPATGTTAQISAERLPLQARGPPSLLI